VRNAELHYAAIAFFVEEEPTSLGKLLASLTPKLDHGRVVHLLRKLGATVEGGPSALLGLCLPYLKSVQAANIAAVNEAVNGVLVDEEDVEGLRASIAAHDAFDQIGLATRLEKHELLQMRRIAASLFKANKRWEASIALSKRDSQFGDAIATASESGDQAQAEGLLTFFVGKGDKESFAATLFTCGRIVRPDVALELAWRARAMDYAMPFMLQFIRDSSARIAALEARVKPKDDSAGIPGGPEDGGLGMPPNPYGYGAPVLALANEAYNPATGGYGGYGGGAPPPPLGGMGAYGVPGGGPGMMPQGGLAPPPPQMGGYGVMPPPGMF
jgi:clathrin heavy chain